MMSLTVIRTATKEHSPMITRIFVSKLHMYYISKKKRLNMTHIKLIKQHAIYNCNFL